MCGLCNLFRRNNRSCGCGCSRNVCDCEANCYRRETRWCEPRMRTTCASGLGSERSCPCGCNDDYSRNDCGCERAYDVCEKDCD